ncbi:bifunctional diaminohydroxyphosphoribosylaminopyrimidine deaminase/5-amino-6-(5-phosphoribosylamino)uracil reductase RibD [Plantibacter auratus]|uniref:Riboflavin biosynthesis protein RibD n=1 Tax=Plantibacter cousiniae (nom. nud.) TaxID=199709 RepID=A0ABY1LR41_9MICO|nr:bifunctional diaminohydroxyphosphoribosylaminopyrimidine deaminase/5-amino-6-(5-phosphoribosylamino)uracil reductase RibD [Plantibacter cousiniae]SKC74898.1 diaminohydroxyphosphoribosylaminopyrimidine deaminase / 5-amino-6-(5-phosphoribosylamino)uracil reductase [Plantibacter cousiniae]
MSAGTEAPQASVREEQAMLRALELAANGPARGVNPRVGCVVLDADGTVLAEGWHRGAGTPHAEVDALSHLAPGAARGATAVVTLEPCNHTGRTGPCAVALLEAGVERVVFAVDDPGHHSGGGAERLRDGGVTVVGGVLAGPAEDLLGDWLTTARLGRPLVTVKWASSLDGRIAASDGTSRWITGDAARDDVHRRRAAHDAILVGTGTVLADDPSLTARDDRGDLLPEQPLPVVMGDRQIPLDAAVHRHPRPVVVHHGHDPAALLAELRAAGVRSVFIEGGPTIATAFLRAGLADTVLTYLAPVLLGGPRLAIGDLGVDTIGDVIRLTTVGVERLGDDLLVITTPDRSVSASAAHHLTA